MLIDRILLFTVNFSLQKFEPFFALLLNKPFSNKKEFLFLLKRNLYFSSFFKKKSFLKKLTKASA